MDNDYLHSIDASPYVEEGFLSHARATGAGLRQRLQNITPSEDPYHTPFYAQLMSHYKSFIKEVKSILSEFVVGPTSPAERLKKMQLTPEERQTIDAFVNLYDQLSPSMFPAGANPETKQNLVRGLTPANISLAQAMQHNIKESWFGRKGAQSTGQASNIINKYVQELQGAYSKFIGNIQKLFPSSPKQNLSKEFKKNVGDPKVSKSVDNVEGVLKTLPTAHQPETEKEPTANAATGVSGAPSSGAPMSVAQPPTKSNPDKDSLAEIVERVVEIMIDAVSSDERSEDWMKKPLPTDWDQPPMTKDEPAQGHDQTAFEEPESPETPPTEEPKSVNEASDKKSSGEHAPEEEEYKGEFLYNFHSKANKYPGGSFNIEVKPSNTSLSTIKLSNGKTKELVVLWAVKTKTENNIYVKHKTVTEVKTSEPSEKPSPTPAAEPSADYSIEEAADSNQWEVTHLFKFWDHQANPRTPNNKFDVNTLIAQAHPSKGNVLNGANPQILEKINSLTEPFLRSCYATTSRKHMEFSPKGLNIRMSDTGRVFHIKRDGHHEEITDDAISLHVKSKNINERKKWIEALQKIGWFARKSQDLGKVIEAPNWKDEPSDAPLLPKKGDAPEPLGKEKTEVGQIPAAADAVAALTSMGGGKAKLGAKTALDLVQKVVDKHGNNLSTQEYIKLAYAEPKVEPKVDPTAPTPSVSTTASTPSASAPAGEPPKKKRVKAPVSKPAGGEPEAAKVTAPVSTPAGKPDPSGGDTPKPTPNLTQKPEGKPTPKPEVQSGNVEFTEDGKVVWTKPDGKVVKLTPNQINNMASPRLMAALKKAKYPFDKFKVNIKETRNGFVNPFQLTNFL